MTAREMLKILYKDGWVIGRKRRTMRKAAYFAVFEPLESGGYSIYFPDVPGCISCGDNLGHAHRMAEEALWLHLYGLEKEGHPFPVPTDTLHIEPETAAGYFISPITIFPDLVKQDIDNRTVKTQVLH